MSRWPVRISQTGSGPTPPGDSLDRFAPKYLVGNTNAGDPDTASTAGLAAGFNYFPDTGNGAGIAAALVAANSNRGDVYIRPGTYNLGAVGSPVTPLAIPAGVRVQGAGYRQSGLTTFDGTVIVANSAPGNSQGVFSMGMSSQLEDLVIQVPQAAEGASGSTSVVKINAPLATIRGVGIFADISLPVESTDLRHLIEIDSVSPVFANPFDAGLVSLENLVLVNDAKSNSTPDDCSIIYMERGEVSARNVLTSGGGIGIEVANAVQASQPVGTGRSCEFRGDDVYVERFKSIGIRYYETGEQPGGRGSIRLNRSKVSVVSQEGSVGVSLDSGSGHALSECNIDVSEAESSVGVFVTAASGTKSGKNTTILGCEIFARAVGVYFSSSNGGSLQSAVLADSHIEVSTFAGECIGVLIAPSGEEVGTVSDIEIDSNTIIVDGGGL